MSNMAQALMAIMDRQGNKSVDVRPTAQPGTTAEVARQLREHRWTDHELLRVMEEDLLEEAFRRSLPLQQEFRKITTLQAYLNHLKESRR